MISRKEPWKSQPQVPVGVDWSNSLARNLEFAWLPAASGVELAGGKAATSAGPSGRVAIGTGALGSIGRGGSNLATRWDGAKFKASSEYTALTLVLDDSGRGLNRNPFDADNASSGYRLFQLRIDTTNTPRAIVFSSGGNAQPVGATVVSATAPSMLGVRVQGSTASVWLNGAQQGSAAISGTPNTLGTSGSRISVGALADEALYFQPFPGQIGVCLYWGRALSDAEIARVSANPWQLFQPRTQYIPVSVTSGPLTHATDGALAGPGAATAGAAARFRAFASSGNLAGQIGSVVGAAARSTGTVSHDNTGALVGPVAAVVGSAARLHLFDSTGNLIGPGALLSGVSARASLYPDPSVVLAGVQYGPGGIYVGTLTGGLSETRISLRSFTGRF